MKKTKRIVTLLLATIILAMTFSSCDALKEIVNSVIGNSESVKYKKVKQKISAEWFEFTVTSAEFTDGYEGETPAEGKDFLVIELNERNTWDSSTPFSDKDYFIDEDSLEEYIYPVAPFTDEMRPDEFDLEPSESLRSTIVFEVPSELKSVYFVYVEMDTKDVRGNTYAVEITR